MNTFLKSALPHVLILIGFVVVSFIYFFPLLQGYSLRQSDIVQYKGMSHEIVQYRAEYDQEPYWTNSMFGGMPAYQISAKYPGNLFNFVDQNIMTLGLGRPANYLFLYMAGFYLLMLVFRIRPPLAAVGAVAFALSTYYLIIIMAGHNSKAHAIAYMAPVLAGIILTYRGRLWLGFSLSAFFLALEVNANHVQITYYFAFLVGFFVLARLVKALKEKQASLFLKRTGLLVGAAVLALLCNVNLLYNSYEYGKATMRGKSDLTIEPGGDPNHHVKTEGLDRDYVTQWSNGLAESFSLLVPNIKGGASGIMLDEEMQRKNPQFYNTAVQMYQQSGYAPASYWGDQPFTSGPVYAGAVVCLLFVLGLFFVRAPVKWAMLATVILTLALSWGHNFMGLTDFFLDYVPLYNKFRAVTIILSVTTFAMVVLAFVFVRNAVRQPELIQAERKKFLIICGSVAGLLVLFLLLPDTFFSFLSDRESAMFSAQVQAGTAPELSLFVQQIKEMRIEVFRGDVLRSLFFVLGAAAAVYLLVNRRLKLPAFSVALLVLVLLDMWPVAKRYLNNEKQQGKYVHWVKSEETPPFEASAADLAILEREMAENPAVEAAVSEATAEARREAKEKHFGRIQDWKLNEARFAALNFNTDYRVLKLGNPFQDAGTSYFHRSIGGYHGAKLKRYQELIDFYLQDELNGFISVLQTQPSPEAVSAALEDLHVLNMLNTRYIIFNPAAPPIENTANMGPAWFVKEVKLVETADAEILQLGEVDLEKTAIVNEDFADQVGELSYSGAGSVEVEQYLPNYIRYRYSTPLKAILVFSEIYYQPGWQAYLDGEPVPHFRANFILRAMSVPAGEHVVEFKFEPQAIATAGIVNGIASGVVILLLLFSLFREIRKQPRLQE